MISSRVGEPVKGRIRRWLGVALTAVSCALLVSAFHPIDFGWLAWVALVPWLFMLAFSRMRPALLCTVGFGFFFVFFGVHWIRHVGDTYIGLALLAAIVSILVLVTGWMIKLLYWGSGLPLALIVPVVWVPMEFVRSFIFSGFPWLHLSHTQHGYLPIIQIAEVTGAWGVSMLIAAVNGALADVLIRWRTKPRAGKPFDRRLAVTVGAVFLLFAADLCYGWVRLSKLEMRDGPKLLVVQGNWPMYKKKKGEGAADRFEVLKTLSEEGLSASPDVDMVIWSETMVPMRYINVPDSGLERYLVPRRMSDWTALTKRNYTILNWLQEYSKKGNVHLLLGAETGKRLEDGLPTASLVPGVVTASDLVKHNSVYFFPPGGVMTTHLPRNVLKSTYRYDKRHVVPIGETAPISAIPPLQKAIAGLIYRFGGFVSDLEPGTKPGVFSLPSRTGEDPYRFGNLICFENGFPGLARQTVCRKGSKAVDFIVNESNDAWFLDSAELDQTVALAVFRAIENRVGFVRAANSGISLFIAPDGSYAPEDVLTDANGKSKDIAGTLTRRVKICDDLTPYSRYGDFLVIGLILIFLALFAYALRPKEFLEDQ